MHSYKFRIYPTAEQEALILKTFDYCHYVYNHFLKERIDTYTLTGKCPTLYQQCKRLSAMKPENTWLCDVDATALQASMKELDAAYKHFFRCVEKRQQAVLPQYRENCKQQYKSSSRSIKVLENAVQLPKLGKIQCSVSREVQGHIYAAAVMRKPSGKFFVSLRCADVDIEPLPATGRIIGLTRGQTAFAVTSDGRRFLNHDDFIKDRKKLEKLRRQLLRKETGSKREEKARLRAARFAERIANRRRDALHKLSAQLICDYDIICIAEEKKGLWGEFQRQLKYKARWYGKRVIVVKEFSQSQPCGAECGGDPEVAAANAILNEGLPKRMRKVKNGFSGSG